MCLIWVSPRRCPGLMCATLSGFGGGFPVETHCMRLPIIWFMDLWNDYAETHAMRLYKPTAAFRFPKGGYFIVGLLHDYPKNGYL